MSVYLVQMNDNEHEIIPLDNAHAHIENGFIENGNFISVGEPGEPRVRGAVRYTFTLVHEIRPAYHVQEHA